MILREVKSTDDKFIFTLEYVGNRIVIKEVDKKEVSPSLVFRIQGFKNWILNQYGSDLN